MPTPAQILPVLCTEVVKELERRGQQHSCISASAILLRVLKLIGCPNAYPLTVAVQIWNKAYKDFFDQHGDPEENPDLATACNDAGGMRVFVGAGPGETDPELWRGHLVVIVPNAFGERHALLDLTICQANQGQYRIVLPSLCLKVDDAFVKGEKSFIGEVNTASFAYKPFPNDHSYLDAPAWTVTEGLDGAAAAVVNRLILR